VGAVRLEPVSGCISLLTGNLAAILRFLKQLRSYPARLTRRIIDTYGILRDLQPMVEQGINLLDLGILDRGINVP
jgi:hypothetical protein